MTRKTKKGGWRRYWPRLLFAIPFTAMLWVPSYNTIEPELGGIPFFYWYQLLWILVGSAIVLLVFVLDTRVTHTAKTSHEELGPEGAPGDIL